jgi:hypothetical protein
MNSGLTRDNVVREGDLNRAQPALAVPDSASLSVKLPPVDSRLIQLGRGRCHTLWHHLDLDFVSDDFEHRTAVSLHRVSVLIG